MVSIVSDVSTATTAHARCVLTGELDLATADDVRRLAKAALEATGPDLTVDLSGVTFLDCSGLSPLICLSRDIQSSGGRLTLTGARPQVRRVFDLTGLAVMLVGPTAPI